MNMKRTQQGMTILEVMGALAIGTALLLGLTTMIDASLDDAKGQQTALHQQQVVNAASKYISANYAALAAATAGGGVAPITVAQLKAGNFLPGSFSVTNPYGQAACVLVRQPASGKLDALVASYGGVPIPDRDIPVTAMKAGQGGGYISAAQPGTARGAAWQLVTTSYRNVACGGAPVLTGSAANDGGHMVSSLFFDGPGQLVTDFLHRDAVPGRPQANQMNTTIHMMPGTDAQAVEDDTLDPRCTVASGTGKIAVDASGRVLSCQSGVWKRQGSGFWENPVATHANLPASGNDAGDVRMVTELNRAFTWNGTQWVPLAVDQNGNFLVPGTLTANLVQLNRIAVANTTCGDNGTIARDDAGLALSCQSGLWRNPLGVRLNKRVYYQGWELTPTLGDRYVVLDLAELPGPRPLYLTGYTTCHATGPDRAMVSLRMIDDAGATVAYAGGCLSQLDVPGNGFQNLGDIGLQKIPENITRLQLIMEPGAAEGDYTTFMLSIYSE